MASEAGIVKSATRILFAASYAVVWPVMPAVQDRVLSAPVVHAAVPRQRRIAALAGLQVAALQR
jgi:hypothetical protein